LLGRLGTAIGLIVTGSGNRAGEPARESHTALVEENNVKATWDVRIERGRIVIRDGDTGGAWPTRDGHEHALPSSASREHGKGHWESAFIPRIEMIQRHIKGYAGELAAIRAGLAAESLEDAVCVGRGDSLKNWRAPRGGSRKRSQQEDSAKHKSNFG
jgi:hypothetical protein